MLGACVAVIIVMLLVVRPATGRPIPARIRAGEAVASEEGLSGTVELVDGEFSLVRIDSSSAAWMRTDALSHEGASAAAVAPPGEAMVHFPRPPAVGAAGTLGRLAHTVTTQAGSIAKGWLLIVLVLAPIAATAEGSLVAGGFLPSGEAQEVQQTVRHGFGLPLSQVTVIVPADQMPVGTKLADLHRALSESQGVAGVSRPRPSDDRTMQAVTIAFDEPEDLAQNHVEPLQVLLHEHGLHGAQVAGGPALMHDMAEQPKKDLAKAEAVGIPAALVVLVLVFGTLVGAALPLIVGLVSVIVTLALLHVLAVPLDLSIYVMNLTTMLGLGLGIDYSLLAVSRFRDELDRDADVARAVRATMASSGRAVAISSVAVGIGMLGLALIDVPALRSIAVGGVVVVVVTAVVSLTLLPALLMLLGPRVNALAIRARRPASERREGVWHRIARGSIRHPGLAIALGLVLLIALALPARHMVPEVAHAEDVLPADTPAQVAERTVEEHFGERLGSPLFVVLDTANRDKAVAFAQQLATLDNAGQTHILARSEERDATLLQVMPQEDRHGGAMARALAERAMALDAPARTLVGGQAVAELEFIEAVREGMPRTVGFVMLTSFLVIAFAFRSIVLPLKAIVLDALSIVASLGVVVAVFQLGVGVGLLGAQPIDFTEVTIPIVLFCMLFGLSMDYEVFMLARINEAYQRGASNEDATVEGVASTAPLITGAALILIVIGISFALTELIMVKQIGFGMAVALALDASIVRFLLLPAAMRLMGDVNWWMPEALMRRIPKTTWH